MGLAGLLIILGIILWLLVNSTIGIILLAIGAGLLLFSFVGGRGGPRWWI